MVTTKCLPSGVIEGYINQHPDMMRLSIKSVNTIRVVTIKSPNIENGKTQFLYAGVRMGKGESYVDNLHSGGMMAIINLENGKIITDGVDFDNNVYIKHPDTGVVIKNTTIPFINELKALIEEAGENAYGYFGWDIAINENGPVIVEVNTNPGADGLQTPYVPQKKGMRYIVEKYIDD